MRRVLPACSLALALAVAGCGGGGGGPGCDNAAGTFPSGLTTLSWDNGTNAGSVRGKGFAVTDNGQTFRLDTLPLFEEVRFDLPRPAKVYGFSILWSNFGATPDGGAPLTAGLYPDFGYSGFDSWHADPLWTGSRCETAQLDSAGPIDYVFPQPLEVSQPGLVFVGHEADQPTDPTFAFDNSPHPGNPCPFASCHSGVDLPQSETGLYFQGLALQFPYDYRVSLQVAFDPDPPPAQKVFEPVAGLPPLGVKFAWGDYDNDGFDDVATYGPRLYHNNGDGTFLEVTSAAGLALVGAEAAHFGAPSGIPSWGDYDNDGCLDLFIAAEGVDSQHNVLLHNDCNGHFTEVTTAAGVGGTLPAGPNCQGNPAYTHPQSEVGTWVDLDGDGWLDLYVSNYNCANTDGSIALDYQDQVFRNNHDGTFTEWTGTRGFGPIPDCGGGDPSQACAGRSALPVDLDGSGRMDLLVTDYDLERDLFYRNLTTGTNGLFAEVAQSNGTAGVSTVFQGVTYWHHSLGAAWGDLDGDGTWDLVVANLAHPRFYNFSGKSQVLLNDGTGHFRDSTAGWATPFQNPSGLLYREGSTSPLLADLDQDGKEDLVISSRYDGQPTDLYWGLGNGTFELDDNHAGLDSAKAGWCIAASDYDHDGALDILTTAGLFHNVLGAPGPGGSFQRSRGHWLQVRVVGDVGKANRGGFGATVKVTAGGKTQLRSVESTTGSGCQSSQVVHFGLGPSQAVEKIEVIFPTPGGDKVWNGPIPADQRLWLYESGTLRTGWVNPT